MLCAGYLHRLWIVSSCYISHISFGLLTYRGIRTVNYTGQHCLYLLLGCGQRLPIVEVWRRNEFGWVLFPKLVNFFGVELILKYFVPFLSFSLNCLLTLLVHKSTPHLRILWWNWHLAQELLFESFDLPVLVLLALLVWYKCPYARPAKWANDVQIVQIRGVEIWFANEIEVWIRRVEDSWVWIGLIWINGISLQMVLDVLFYFFGYFLDMRRNRPSLRRKIIAILGSWHCWELKILIRLLSVRWKRVC